MLVQAVYYIFNSSQSLRKCQCPKGVDVRVTGSQTLRHQLLKVFRFVQTCGTKSVSPAVSHRARQSRGVPWAAVIEIRTCILLM